MSENENEVKAYLKISKKNKLTLGLFLTKRQIEKYVLQKGVQPNNIITICITQLRGNE